MQLKGFLWTNKESKNFLCHNFWLSVECNISCECAEITISDSALMPHIRDCIAQGHEGKLRVS